MDLLIVEETGLVDFGLVALGLADHLEPLKPCREVCNTENIGVKEVNV
jgi:hypothetical protein